MPIFTDNDATLQAVASGSITDAAGNAWTIANGRVLVNGQTDWSTDRVVSLIYSQSEVWQENADDLWWGRTDPSAAWLPTYGTPNAPTPGPNAAVSVVTMNSENYPIIDDNRSAWTIVNSQVAVNGVVDTGTSQVVELAYVDGRIWQENASGGWWSKVNPPDQWDPPTAAGNSTSPVQNTVRTWEGGAGSAAFSWGDHWTPKGVPQAGDTAVVNDGTVAMDPGAGFNVNFSLGGGEVDFQNNGGYYLGQLQGSGIVSLHGTNYRQSGPTVAVSVGGVNLTVGNSLVITDYQNSGLFILRGNSSVANAGLSVVEQGINHVPYAPIESDGTLSVGRASFTAGLVSGSGTIDLVNKSFAQIQSGSQTNINFSDSALEIGNYYDPGEMKTIHGTLSNFDDSSIQIDYTQAVLEVVKHTTADAKELFLISADNKVVGDFNFAGGASTIYAATSGGGIVLTASDNGHSLPIIDV